MAGNAAEPEPVILPVDIHVTVNGDPITMRGKNEYVFVDIFDYIDSHVGFLGNLLNGHSILEASYYLATLKSLFITTFNALLY